MVHSGRLVTLMMLAGVSLSCGSDTTQPSQGTDAITLSMTPSSAIVEQGGSTTISGKITRSGSFNSPVNVTMTEVPMGVTVVPNNVTTLGRVTTAAFTVQVTAATVPGVYNLIAQGQGSGVADATSTFVLTVTEAAAFMLSLSSTEVTIAPAGNAPITVNLGRTNFTGGVTLSFEGAATGVTGVFSPMPSTGASSTLTISVGAAVAAGTQTLTVRGSATGQSDRTATIILTISAAASYTLAANPAALTIVQGSAGTTTVDIARSNFADAVTLSLSGAPAGATDSFSPAAPTGNTSTLTVNVGAGVAPGVYNLTVDGTGTAGNRSTSLMLTVIATADYQLSLTPRTVSVVQGATGTTTVQIARTSFTDAVTLSLGNAPTGVTGSFNPVVPTGNTSTLTLNVGVGVTPGVYDLAVNGASTAGNRATPLTVTVTAVADYSLSLSPAALTVAQGATGTSTVNISRTNFTGAVDLTLSNAPAGITGSFSAASTTGNNSTLTVGVGSAVAPGVYNLSVNGTSTLNRSTTLTLTVTSAGGSTGVTLAFAACGEKPVWVAFQDGDGQWTRLTSTNNFYSFTLTSGRGGLAFVTIPGVNLPYLVVQYFTAAEFSSVTSCQTLGTINGTVTGLDGTHSARISLGLGFGFASSTVPNFQIERVRTGTYDLVGYRGVLTFGNSLNDRAIIRRDQDIPNGGSVGTLDFNGSESFAVVSAPITVAGLVGGETVTANMYYNTGAACTRAGYQYVLTNLGSTFIATGIPDAQQRSSDFHKLSIGVGTGDASSRGVSEYFHTLGARTISLGAEMPVPVITLLGGPYRRLQAAYTLPPGYNGSTYLLAGGKSTIHASFAYLGGPSVTLSLPDFSAVQGWDNNWAPASGSTEGWAVGASGSTGSPCTENARTINADRSGSFTAR